MRITEAVRGYTINKQAEGYAASTLRIYQHRFDRLISQLKDTEIEQITASDLREFFVWIRKENSNLAESSIHGYWKAVRSLWSWASDELHIPNIALEIPAPRYKLKPIIPFSREEILLLLHSCEKDAAGHKRRTSVRDRAIILFLLDTGLRRGEFCRLRVGDVNLDTGQVIVNPYGRGRKTAGRIVFIGSASRKALWRYLSSYDGETLFNLNENALQNLIRRLGERCGVAAHSHRFRHTFAINFLRNGGNVFELQRLLGHSTLDMVRHYLDIAESDTENAHRRASPVDRWNL